MPFRLELSLCSGCTVASSSRPSTLATPCPLLHATPPLLRYTAAASIPTFFPHSAILVHHVTHALHVFSDLGLISIISAVLYISLHQQVDPYPFLFGSPARCASCLVYFLYNKLNSLDPLLVPRSALLRLPTFRSVFRPTAVALTGSGRDITRGRFAAGGRT